MIDTLKEKKCAYVVYASDDKFAEIMGVSMVSLFSNSLDLDEIIVYILDSGITSENKRKIEDISQNFLYSTLYWIPAKNISQELSMRISADRGSLSQYARLFVSSILPMHVNKVLYLDCDTIINKSILNLWELDMQGKTIAALMDAFSKSYRANIGLKPDDIMFNSGVMLIDLNRWREQKVEDRLLKFIIDNKGRIQQGDQGALNAILSHEVYCFEPMFNSLTIFYDFTYKELMIYRKPPKFYSESAIKVAIEEPVIIHFTTSFLSRRPWIEGCNHRYVERWLSYKAMCQWNNSSLWKYHKVKWREFAIMFYQGTPTFISVRLAGIFQAYLRPIKKYLENY